MVEWSGVFWCLGSNEWGTVLMMEVHRAGYKP